MSSRAPRSTVLLAFVLFFVSGASALVYQVIWLRLLVLIFGSTLFATSAILATFMGGLALGAFLAGRSMDRSRHSALRVYGVLEIGIGVYALLVPFLFDALTPVYRAVWDAGGSANLLILNLAKFAGIAVVLIVPTTLMGASLPVLARDVADDPDRIGGKVGTLYAVNTFGAVAGTFVAGFVAIPAIGVQMSLWWTAAINVVLGVVAIVAGRRSSAPLPARAEPSTTSGPARIGGRTAVLLFLFGLSGFGAMVLEVAWTRALSLVLGSSVYAFSLMLVAFLVGLASGGAFFSGVLRRRPLLHPGSLLAGLLAASGVLSFATVFVFQHLPRWFGQIYFAHEPSPNQWFAVQFLFGLVVMFPATFAFGGIFPAVLQSHARGLDRVAGSVGTVYTSNTAGTILGAACAGFVLIPTLGVQDSVVLVAASQVVLGGLAVLALSGLARRPRTVTAIVLVTLAVLFPAIRPRWDALLMNSGVYMNLQDMPEGSTWKDFLEIVRKDNELVYARQGMTASVLVADQPSIGNRYLAVNGKIEASTNADMETQLMCAHLPLMLHDDPRDVMIIGLASAITVGAAAAHPTVDSIRVVEVEEAMIPAARLFEEDNRGVMDDPRLEISINDARNELEFSSADYDVIVSEPSNPWMTVASNLFTEDFFRMAAKRVRPGGIFAQWVQNYYLPAEDLRSIVAAFHAAFPYVHVFETFEGVDLLLLGSREPLPIDLERIGTRMSELSVRMDLARVDVRRPADVLPLFVLGPGQVDRFVEGAPRNTDDNARVEFSAPKALYQNTLDRNLSLLHRHSGDPLEYVRPKPENPETRAELLLDLARAYVARERWQDARDVLEGLLDGPAADRARDLAERAELPI